MSKIKLEGNASGTGTLTISAPSTNTDRTLTLPDTAGEFVTANASGNVGIGTDSPTALSNYTSVVANNSTGSMFELMVGGTRTANIQTSASAMNIQTRTNIPMIFDTNNTERMRIDSSGRLLVNTSTSFATGYRQNIQVEGTAGGLAIQSGGTSMTAVAFDNGVGTRIGSISCSNTATAYNTSSDYRLKENVVDMTGAINRVKALQPKRFNFIADEDDTTVDGFLAHEVSDVIPEAISGEKDATKEEEYEVTPAVLDDDDNVVTEAVMGTRTVPDYQGIDQSKLVPLLTGALQEAIAKIEALETRIEALENA